MSDHPLSEPHGGPLPFSWGYRPSKERMPGAFLILDEPTGGARIWAIHIRAWDGIAQRHIMNGAKRPEVRIAMPDGQVLAVPWPVFDRQADAWDAAHPLCPPDQPVDIPGVGDGIPTRIFHSAVASHLSERASEPPARIVLGGETLEIPFACFDAMAKDWLRRRADMIAEGMFPELVCEWPEAAIEETSDREVPADLTQPLSLPGAGDEPPPDIF